MYALEDGTKVIQEAAWAQVSQVDRFDVEIHGDKGALYIKHEFFAGAAASGHHAKAASKIDTQWSAPEVEKTFWGERQHRLFIEDIRNDTSNSLSARDGFITLATMEAVCRSCESGTWETRAPRD